MSGNYLSLVHIYDLWELPKPRPILPESYLMSGIYLSLAPYDLSLSDNCQALVSNPCLQVT